VNWARVSKAKEAAKFLWSPSPCGTWPRREYISSCEIGGFDTNLGEKDIKGALSTIREIVTGPIPACSRISALAVMRGSN
jgi:hypothetical protein